MKYPKPGDKPKGKIKSKSQRKRSLRIEDENNCTHCNETTGTERMCHSEATEIKMMSGGGIIGSTINDKLTARLCFDCDQLLSTKPLKSDLKANLLHENVWWRAIAKTWLI